MSCNCRFFRHRKPVARYSVSEVPTKISIAHRTVTDLNALAWHVENGGTLRVDDVSGNDGCANTPVSGSGFYIVVTAPSSDYYNFGIQIAFSYALVGTHMYMRRYANAGWESWITIK